MNYKHSDITEKIIKAFYNVYNQLGYGFLEKVYENSMVLELGSFGLATKNQVPIKVFYKDDYLVGEYFADLIIEDKVIVELKAQEGLCVEHEAQLLNYLRATNIEVGLLLNFGKKPEFKRKVWTNEVERIGHPNKTISENHGDHGDQRSIHIER